MTVKVCLIENCSRTVFAKGMCCAHYKRNVRYGTPHGGGTHIGAPMKWIEEVALASNTDECVIWPFGKAAGYGSVRVGNVAEGVHRIVCRRANGEPPVGKPEAAHSCGERACCNPRHLRWATPRENCADKKIHGTQPVGERVGGAKFKDSDVIEMRRLRKCGLTFQEISDQFDHDIGATRRIIIGETWAHLPI